METSPDTTTGEACTDTPQSPGEASGYTSPLPRGFSVPQHEEQSGEGLSVGEIENTSRHKSTGNYIDKTCSHLVKPRSPAFLMLLS